MLPKLFFEKDALVLAPALLGCELVHKMQEGVTSGVIVETECYSQDDAASHSYRGETERTKVMFGSGGYAYIYFTYGMHYCFNVVSGSKGSGQAVLIRALEPKQGMKFMQERRGKQNVHDLCNGPAKLVQAMGITKADYGKPLFEGNLYVKPRLNDSIKISTGPRVGIKKEIEKHWRFWLTDNPFISK
jgi:DNA-3-methyladenine glycosylase